MFIQPTKTVIPTSFIRLLSFFLLLFPIQSFAADYVLQPEKSELSVHIPRAGFLKVLGHDHTIVARQFEGRVEIPGNRIEDCRIRLVVPVDSLVVQDEEVDDKTRSKIDTEMRGKNVLDEENHSLIEFHSEEVAHQGNDIWLISGILTVAGVDQSVEFTAEVSFSDSQNIQAAGKVDLKPEKFGIQPVKALGGAVRTARTIEIRFDVVGVKTQSGKS